MSGDRQTGYEEPGSKDSFLGRWSRRKLEEGQESKSQPLVEAGEDAIPEPPGDEEMPPLESLDEHSDYSAFLSPNVSEQLRRMALRRLFHSPLFNVCDGLDDYDEDFRNLSALGSLVTAEMRWRMNEAAERLESAAGDAVAGSLDEGRETAGGMAVAETDEEEREDDEVG